MRYFFRRKVPQAGDILLIESGSRQVSTRALEGIKRIFPQARYHLCTCLPETPPDSYASVFRASDYPSGISKLKLLFWFRRQRWPVMAVLCTGEPLLLRWKLIAGLIVPAKVLIVNEHADFFWLNDLLHRT